MHFIPRYVIQLFSDAFSPYPLGGNVPSSSHDPISQGVIGGLLQPLQKSRKMFDSYWMMALLRMIVSSPCSMNHLFFKKWPHICAHARTRTHTHPHTHIFFKFSELHVSSIFHGPRVFFVRRPLIPHRSVRHMGTVLGAPAGLWLVSTPGLRHNVLGFSWMGVI